MSKKPNKNKRFLAVISIISIVLILSNLSLYMDIVNAEDNICPICGMAWDGTTTGIIENETYYYCCPVCALKHVVPQINGEIFGKCYTTGENISIYIKNGNTSLVIPDTTVISLGGKCPINKLFMNETLANSFNSSRPALSVQTVIEQKINPPLDEPDSEEKEEELIDQDQTGTPGFELIVFLISIAIAYIIIKKKH